MSPRLLAFPGVWLVACALTATAQQPVLQPLDRAVSIAPSRLAGVHVIDGVVRIGTWYDYDPAARIERGGWTWAFDAFDNSRTGDGPGDPNPSVCDGPIGCGRPCGYCARWFFGITYCNPFVADDMNDVAADRADGLFLSWTWYVNGPGSSEPMYLVVLSTETFAEDCSDDGSESILGGVVLDFGDTPSLSEGYFTTCVDLRSRSFPLPVDGRGGYQWILARDVTDGFTLATCGQPMLWGTGDGETPNDGRVGTQNQIWYHPPDELNPCYYFDFPGVCPRPIGVCIGFSHFSGDGCRCDGDFDDDGDRDLSDLAEFLAAFGLAGPPGSLGCADLDADGAVGLQDLARFLADFGVACR